MLTIPQKLVAYNGDPKGQHLYGEQRLQIAEVLYNAGYRKVPKGSFICSESETNLDVEICNNCGMEQADEVVNIKIGEILEKHSEEIYIGERLDRIWQKHPEFDAEVESIDDIKKNPLFLSYLKELII